MSLDTNLATNLSTNLATNLAGGGGSIFQQVLGANLLFEFAASDLTATPVSSWASRNGNGTLTAAGAARPTWANNSFNSGPGVTFDGVANDMRATLVSAVLSGQRPYVWWVAQWPSAAGTQIAGVIADALPLNVSYLEMYTGAGTYQSARKPSDGAETVNSTVAVDANRHLIKTGLTAGGTACMVADAVSANGAKAGGAGSDLPVFELGCENGAFFANVRFAHIVAARTGVATGDATDTAITALLKGANFPLYSGGNYGLP